MGRKAQTQWDFGEVTSPAATRRVLSVTELTGQVKRLLEAQYASLWVSGEVSNLRVQASGHSYFTVKDAGAQLSCVLFRGDARMGRDLLQDGRKVLLHGELTVYEPRGQYQLRVVKVELEGVGALQLAFEKLKAKLGAEGLFDPARKRPIPELPFRIGVVTSPTGAAFRDVLHVLGRRHPGLEVILAPCRVQGTGAAEEIAAAISLLNRWSSETPANRLDAILVTRGGGSIEDLWAFNEEVVARAIVASELPVVSAVGHEIDFTIADFAADLRAATPSAAAEILTQRAVVVFEWLMEAAARLTALADRASKRKAERAVDFSRRLARAHPLRKIEELGQRVDDAQVGMRRATLSRLRETELQLKSARLRWESRRPVMLLEMRRERLRDLQRRLRESAVYAAEAATHELNRLQERLRLLSPQAVLARGYSLTWDAESNRLLRDAKQARPGTRLRTRLACGETISVVEEVEADPNGSVNPPSDTPCGAGVL